jgi:DNA-binding MarR family transcriptional regulator
MCIYTQVMARVVDMSRCSECLCLASRRTARTITRVFDRHLRPQGLRATQFSVLVVLALTGSMPMRRLAKALGLERTTLTRSVALLERRGWVVGGRSDDARERPIDLTAAGRRQVEAAFPAWEAAQGAVRARLGADGAKAFKRFARQSAAFTAD